MPLPSPNQGESQDDFVGRCMDHDAMNQEYPDQTQRAAVCYSQWQRHSQNNQGLHVNFHVIRVEQD